VRKQISPTVAVVVGLLVVVLAVALWQTTYELAPYNQARTTNASIAPSAPALVETSDTPPDGAAHTHRVSADRD
jgi:hypothetical protein